MHRPPVPVGESLFANGLGERIALEGVMVGLLSLLAFGIGHLYFDAPGLHLVGRTMAFAVLSLSQLVHAFNMRSNGSVLRLPLRNNWWLVGAFVLGTLLQVTVISLPALAAVFGVTSLSALQWSVVAGLSILPLFIVELEKRLSPVV